MDLCVNQPLDLKLNLTMGQAFRWTGPDIDGWFSGVVEGILIKIRRTGNGVEFRSSKLEESVRPLLERYLRMDQDVLCIYDELSRTDLKMAELVKQYKGLRILSQEPWECLVSYICSNSNSVRRIRRIVESLADRFGEPLHLDGVTRKSFPQAESLAKVGAAGLKPFVMMWQRAYCIHEVATDVAASRLDLDALGRMCYGEAKERLVAYKGIGPKIADCVLLFSLNKLEAFPIDRHVLHGLLKRYRNRGFPDRKPPTHPENLQWAQERFGANSGYANQFLFHDEWPESAKR